MAKNKKIITICTSASFYKHIDEIEKELKKMGFWVKFPKTVYKMRKTKNWDEKIYKTWLNNKEDYKRKTHFIKHHFKKIINSNAVLILNYEKNGMKGYIGGNTLMEMTLAFHYKKPIFIYNPVSEQSSILEEIYGLKPIFLNQDLKLIRKRIR